VSTKTLDVESITATGVRHLQPYQPGKSVEELERELGLSSIIKLASNENPWGASPATVAAVTRVLTGLERYPDGSGHRLKNALSRHLGVSSGQVTLGNGSNDVLEILVRCFVEPGEGVVVSEHAFAVYTLAAQSVNAAISTVPACSYGHDLEAMAQAVDETTKLIFIANPNNPTGTCVGYEELLGFLEGLPENAITVLDEAYFEYVSDRDYPNGVELLERFPGLVVTRTFSKVYGLAGLRVGYAIASEAITETLNRVRQPFNVNSLALAAAETALSDVQFVRVSREENIKGMSQLCAGFEALELGWIPSSGNFICVKVGSNANKIYMSMLGQGVIVRPVANYGLPEHLRVTIGLPQENQRLLEALAMALQKKRA
jgi:histidinol-phosphate aminotransferase